MWIADLGFYGCKNLETINIPTRVQSLGDSAFACCNRLANITLGPKLGPDRDVRMYGICGGVKYNAFDGCHKLEGLIEKAGFAKRVRGSWGNPNIISFLSRRYKNERNVLWFAVLMSIEHLRVTFLDNPVSTEKTILARNKPPPQGQLNGRLAYEIITADEVWRHIISFLDDGEGYYVEGIRMSEKKTV